MRPSTQASHHARLLRERNALLVAVARFLGMSLGPGAEISTATTIRRAALDGTLLATLRRRAGRLERIPR